ncbi:solute carrier family 35 member F5 [Planococcus citri]|uniref:solute carrier family 35 member F5 n=1 Tax=Planococcus citri TaxID=170843 RepID=UPI0031F88443
MNTYTNDKGMPNKPKRLLIGLLILTLVDVIWASFSELDKFMNQKEKFEKPFFVTYVKTSLFTIYLFAVCLWPSWKDGFQKPSDYNYITEDVEDDICLQGTSDSKLSSPSYVPINFGGKSSGTESDDSTISRSVRFKKLAEVRQMSEEDATEALLARLSYSATIRISKAIPFTPNNKLTVFQTAWLSLPFGFLWFISNYTMHTASFKSEFNNQAVFSASSATFVMTLSAMFPVRPCDKFSLTKLFVVLVIVGALCLITFGDIDLNYNLIELKTRSSVLLTVFSGFLFSLSVVFLMNNADHEEKLDIPLLCGFMGLFCLAILWPGFLLLHFVKWELFEWPTPYQWSFLLVDGLLGTMLSQVLWLWGCFLTSSLLATVAISLTVPLCLLMDTFLFDVKHDSIVLIGIFPMFLFFGILVCLTLLPSLDPVLEVILKAWSMVCNNRSFKMSEYDLEQSESLIGVNDGDSHEA